MLERKGYVSIRIDEENRKIHRLSLTEKSRPIAAELWQIYEDCQMRILDGITKEEVKAVYGFFEKCDVNVVKEIDRLKSEETR